PATAAKFAYSRKNYLGCLEPSREVLDSIRHLSLREHYARAEQRISARPQLARPTRCRNEAESVGSQTRRCRGRQETLFAKLHGMSWSGRLWPGDKACCRFAASGRAESK